MCLVQHLWSVTFFSLPGRKGWVSGKVLADKLGAEVVEWDICKTPPKGKQLTLNTFPFPFLACVCSVQSHNNTECSTRMYLFKSTSQPHQSEMPVQDRQWECVAGVDGGSTFLKREGLCTERWWECVLDRCLFKNSTLHLVSWRKGEGGGRQRKASAKLLSITLWNSAV